jgi:predicted membrane-bound spermidine synthase
MGSSRGESIMKLITIVGYFFNMMIGITFSAILIGTLDNYVESNHVYQWGLIIWWWIIAFGIGGQLSTFITNQK